MWTLVCTLYEGPGYPLKAETLLSKAFIETHHTFLSARFCILTDHTARIFHILSTATFKAVNQMSSLVLQLQGICKTLQKPNSLFSMKTASINFATTFYRHWTESINFLHRMLLVGCCWLLLPPPVKIFDSHFWSRCCFFFFYVGDQLKQNLATPCFRQIYQSRGGFFNKSLFVIVLPL